MDHEPLVSIITPTSKSRSRVLENLKRMIAAQTYKNFEHIIVEEDNCFKGRNKAISQAKGAIIVHADDDDFYHPLWVEKSVRHLLTTGAMITGLKEHYYYDIKTGKSYLFSYSANQNQWAADATLCYLKSFWHTHKFEEQHRYGSDVIFVNSCPNVIPHTFIDGFVSILHHENTSPKNIEYFINNIDPETHQVKPRLVKDKQWIECRLFDLPSFFFHKISLNQLPLL